MIIEKCKSKEGYKVKAEEMKKLDLIRLKQNDNWETISWTSIAASGKYNGVEVIVHQYGEIQFKFENNTEKIKEIASKLYELLEDAKNQLVPKEN